MAWFSKLNPTPAFPDYTGPYQVGSVDVEIPANELDAPSPAPNSTISTVSFRMFYPCEPNATRHPVRWLPDPQRAYLAAYTKFLGASPPVASAFALIPNLTYYITIPARRNALLLPAEESKKWPVMVFSHGLGGSRNAYSHICGSIASHGVVVLAPDHRDGSSPISYIRATNESPARSVKYVSHPHEPTQEVFEARDEMLKIRLWELGLIYDAITKIDEGKTIKNLDPNSLHGRKKDVNDVLSMFHHSLDVHRPGAIAWAGHSFGAATALQFVKSIYYRQDTEIAGYTPLFTPKSSSSLISQVTPSSPIVLLDMWCMPLQSPATSWLHDKPLPCYTPSGPGGRAVLAILSEDFFKWREHLLQTKRILSEDPSSDSAPHNRPAPNFFYPSQSAHLSQSDFGVLFPWMTKKMFNCDDPERTLQLNARAILQLLRDSNWTVADTQLPAANKVEPQTAATEDAPAPESQRQDPDILDPESTIEGWNYITTDQNTLELAERKPSPPPGPVKEMVEREVLAEVTKRPSRWNRSKSSDSILRFKSKAKSFSGKADVADDAPTTRNTSSARPKFRTTVTSFTVRTIPNASNKDGPGIDKVKGAVKEKEPLLMQARRISYKRGHSYA